MSEPVFMASFDVEDWFHAANLAPYVGGAEWDLLEGRVERNTHELLDLLDQLGVKSTFFVLGWIGRRYPSLVRRIHQDGHEVASHTDQHRLLSTLPQSEVVEDLARSKGTLEDLIGSRVLGIRAPNFSISDEVLDSIAQAGYWYDSSFFSLRGHGRYGRLASTIDPDREVVEARPSLLELPMSRVRLGGVPLPWSGGAYFRLIPYPVFRWGVARRLGSQSWFMFYFHPWELDAEEAPPPAMTRLGRYRSYLGRPRMRRDLRRLLERFGSRRIDDSLRSIGFVPPVV